MINFSFFQVMEHRWNEIDIGKPKYSGKTCPSATLSTTNPIWTDPGSNLSLRGGRPATNRLSHGTASPNALPMGEKSPATHRIGGWVDPTVGLDASDRKTIFQVPPPRPQASNPTTTNCLARSLVTIPTVLYWLFIT